jgi:pimeloyl-ACP methyl ester carboxylesterase
MAAKHEGIYYESKGKGPPLVLIHGGQMDRRMWDFQFEEFANEYRVIRCDIRGFGKSDVPLRPYSYAEDLTSLLKHLKVDKASVAGLSLGAAIAMDFAIVHPEMVKALILVCPGLGGFKFEDKANDLRAITDAAREENYDKAAELWAQNPYMSVAMENPKIQSRLRTLSRENAHCWLNNPVLLRRLTPPAAERLREIRAPTLIVGGGRDVSDIHRIIAKLRTEIPNAEEHILPKYGHIVPMEAPAEFNAILARFLAKNHRER